MVVLTPEDEAYLVVALDTAVDRFITAGTVVGKLPPPLKGVPSELDFVAHLIISDSVSLMEPVKVTPRELNENSGQYVFQRVMMDTTYVFSGVRIKKAPPSLDHISFGVATDHFGSRSPEDYLTVVDPYNTETQVRIAEVLGTVLYPANGMRALLSASVLAGGRTPDRGQTERLLREPDC